MRIVFIGQNPSRTNIDENVAFLGSKSYSTLRRWVEDMGMNEEHISLVNASRKLGKVTLKDGDYEGLAKRLIDIMPEKVVCLGTYSEKVFQKTCKLMGWEHVSFFTLPHPSGLNRKLNDKAYVEKILKECRGYLKK